MRKNNILFICTGNINRSAAADIILNFHGAGEYGVKSCGTGKTAFGNNPMSKRMREVLSGMGYEVGNFRSRGISEEDVTWANKIVAMGNSHLKYVRENFPEEFNKVIPWNVKDPHFSPGNSVHREVARQLEKQILDQFC